MVHHLGLVENLGQGAPAVLADQLGEGRRQLDALAGLLDDAVRRQRPEHVADASFR
jgi:hypothetical protein